MQTQTCALSLNVRIYCCFPISKSNFLCVLCDFAFNFHCCLLYNSVKLIKQEQRHTYVYTCFRSYLFWTRIFQYCCYSLHALLDRCSIRGVQQLSMSERSTYGHYWTRNVIWQLGPARKQSNQLKRRFPSFIFWINLSWNQSEPYRRLLDHFSIYAGHLITWTIY